jgi:hypothetical protein
VAGRQTHRLRGLPRATTLAPGKVGRVVVQQSDAATTEGGALMRSGDGSGRGGHGMLR